MIMLLNCIRSLRPSLFALGLVSLIAANCILVGERAKAESVGPTWMDDLNMPLPGQFNSLGMTGKDSVVYSNLSKVALSALKSNRIPFVKTGFGGSPIAVETILEDFSAFCLDHDANDKIAWRRGTGHALWLQFSCLKDGDFPAIRERLFTMTLTPELAEPQRSAKGQKKSSQALQWSLVDFQQLAAEVEPGSTLELKSSDGTGLKSPIARATIAVTGAILFSSLAAKNSSNQSRGNSHHIIASGVLAAGSASYFHFVQDMAPEKAALAGGALSLLIGGSKETLDPYLGGVRSRHDMKANLIGATLGTVTVYLSFKFN